MQLVSDGNVVRWRRETTAAASSYNGLGRVSHVNSAVNTGKNGKSNCQCWKTICLPVLTVARDVTGHAVAQLVEALRYKSEGRGFDSRWCHWNFSLT